MHNHTEGVVKDMFGKQGCQTETLGLKKAMKNIEFHVHRRMRTPYDFHWQSLAGTSIWTDVSVSCCETTFSLRSLKRYHNVCLDIGSVAYTVKVLGSSVPAHITKMSGSNEIL